MSTRTRRRTKLRTILLAGVSVFDIAASQRSYVAGPPRRPAPAVKPSVTSSSNWASGSIHANFYVIDQRPSVTAASPVEAGA